MMYQNIQKCKAVGKTCAACHKEGHFREMCRKQNPHIARKFLSNARLMNIEGFENKAQLYWIIDENEGLEEEDLKDDSSIAELENMFTIAKETNFIVLQNEDEENKYHYRVDTEDNVNKEEELEEQWKDSNAGEDGMKEEETKEEGGEERTRYLVKTLPSKMTLW